MQIKWYLSRRHPAPLTTPFLILWLLLPSAINCFTSYSSFCTLSMSFLVPFPSPKIKDLSRPKDQLSVLLSFSKASALLLPSTPCSGAHIQHLQSPAGNFYWYIPVISSSVHLKLSNHLAFTIFANTTILPELTSLNFPCLFPHPKLNGHQMLSFSLTSHIYHHEAPGHLTPKLLSSFCTQT